MLYQIHKALEYGVRLPTALALRYAFNLMRLPWASGVFYLTLCRFISIVTDILRAKKSIYIGELCTMHELAILLPIYYFDNIDHLKLAVESLFNQTYTDYDIIFCVDGPLRDECVTYINELDKKDNVIVLRNEKNRGLSFVLNDGIRYCTEKKYEYIARMDADDISLENRLEEQMKFLKANPDVDIVGCNLIFIDSHGNLFNKEVVYPETHEGCYKFFQRRDCVPHPAVLYRNTYFEKAGLYDEEYVGLKNYEDTMMWYQGLKNNCKFANVQKLLFKYRVNENLFQVRRKGTKRAFVLLKDRFIINYNLKYGPRAYINAILIFILTILPIWIKKLLYKYFY